MSVTTFAELFGAVFPEPGELLSGVECGPLGDDIVGTYVVVAANDVRSGVTFGPASASTGTLQVSGIQFDPTYTGRAH